jgi:pimeloyl-ACP methyl ester carboxylesterase
VSEVQTAAGRRIWYDESGAGPPVLLLTGAFAGRAIFWGPTIAALAPRHRVLAMDNRDAGESDPEPAPYTMDALDGDAVALLDALGIARAHVVGLSMGGMIAIHMAAAHPERVGRLVLSGTAPPLSERGRVPPPTPPPWWDEAVAERVRRVLPGLVGPAFRAELTEDRLAALAALDAPNRIDLAGVQRQRHAMASYHRQARFRQVRAPTLVLNGALDHPEWAQTLAAGIPGAQLELLPDTAHLVTLEQPAAVERILLEFLAPVP